MRVLCNELTRINSHLVWLGTRAMDIGAMTVFLYCFREREELLKLFEAVSGQRMMTSYFRVGGVALEPPLGWFDRVKSFADTFPSKVDEYEGLLTNNPIFVMRTKGVAADERRCAGPGRYRSDDARQRDRFRHPARHAVFGLREVPVQGPGADGRRCICAVSVPGAGAARELQDRAAGAGWDAGGPIKADAPKVVLPDREKMKTQMESLIYHFKIVTEGFTVPPGEVY